MENIQHNTKVKWPTTNSGRTTKFHFFHDQVIGKGAERVVHPTVENKTGLKYVTKVPLSDNDPILTNEHTCKYVVAAYNCANKLCDAWNRKYPDAIQVQFIPCTYTPYKVRDGYNVGGKQKFYLHEKYMEGGKFVKWNNNMGQLHPESKEDDIQAFAHFCYHETNGARMLLDLQGMFYETFEKYMLTDPALISNTPGGGICGPTDMGNHAIKNFFTTHDPATCAKMRCKGLDRPVISNLETIPLEKLIGNRGVGSTQSQPLAQSVLNAGKAILLNDEAFMKSLHCSQILGMKDEQEQYLRMQMEALAIHGKGDMPIQVHDKLKEILPEVVPNHQKGQNPKHENAGGLTKKQLEDICNDWKDDDWN